MPTLWSQQCLCNEGLVPGPRLALVGEAAPLDNGTEGRFSWKISDLRTGRPLCTLSCAPPALLGAG